MRILLVAINAKFIHSNLAVYSLRAYAKKFLEKCGMDGRIDIEIAEYTINQQPDDILKGIYGKEPEVLCFSCYIWNMVYVENLVTEVHKLLPKTDIWLGGPEVSYDGESVLKRLSGVRGVMKGEGERTFAEICCIYAEEKYTLGGKKNDRFQDRFSRTDGIDFQCSDGKVRINVWREPLDLDELPFVYGDERKFGHKIIYYETSRGCPFSCSYCLSSVDKRLRFRSLALVKKELKFFLEQKVPQVKFVDRTFNCRRGHAMEIWKYIAAHDNGVTNFHFEVAADLFGEEELALIETMRPGLIQLEIGVQTTNPVTVREIRRTMKLEKLKENVSRIKKMGNVLQHLDLIAGLPYEDIKSFSRSFDDIYALRPDELQLGFLKVLKGSYMEENKETYALVHKSLPPYEVLCTKWLSYKEIVELKGVEEMVEVYYNSGQFAHTMDALFDEYGSAYQMYRELWQYYERKHYMEIQHKRSARYEILLEFVQEYFPGKTEYMRELLTYDYYLRENAKTRPQFAGVYMVDRKFSREFYEKEVKMHEYLPKYISYDKNQMRKMTHIEYFSNLRKMLLFDYMCRNPLNQNARTCMIKRSSEKEGLIQDEL